MWGGHETPSEGTGPQKEPLTVNVRSPLPLHAPSGAELPPTRNSTYSSGATLRPFSQALVPPRCVGNVGPKSVNARLPVLWIRYFTSSGHTSELR